MKARVEQAVRAEQAVRPRLTSVEKLRRAVKFVENLL